MFKPEDRPMVVGLKKLLDEATFHLKKREVAAFVKINNWIVELEQRMLDAENEKVEDPLLEEKKPVKKKATRK